MISQTLRVIILFGATSCASAEQPHELIICSTRVIQSPKLAVQHFNSISYFHAFSSHHRVFRLFHSPLSFAKDTMANAIAMLELQRVKLDSQSLGNLQIGSKVKNSSVKDNENDEKIARRQLPSGVSYQNGEYPNESLWMSLVPPNHDLIQNVRKPKPSKTIKTIKTIKVNNHMFHPCKHPPTVPESVQCLSHLARR